MIMTVFNYLVLANHVPAAAVIREGQALFGLIWRKGYVDGLGYYNLKTIIILWKKL